MKKIKLIFEKIKLFLNGDNSEATKALRDEIQREANFSEKLITWSQLGVIALLFIFWYVSLKEEHTDIRYKIIPIVLTAYLPFVLAKLYWAYKNMINGAVVFLSTMIDFGILTSLIWFFHIQYQQPPAFYLKAPTFVYFFLFIAFRSLSFDPKHILMTGLVAVLSWIALVTYAYLDPQTTFTESFLEYTNSQSLFPSAEMEKIVGIITVSLLLAIAAARAKKLLVRSVKGIKISKDMSRFFSPEISKIITNSQFTLEPGYGEQRFSAILAIDIRGFTKLSTRMTPVQTMSLITEYQSHIAPLIFKNKGCIDKYMGDGILAHFGAATPNSTFAADCLRAMDDILKEIEDWNKQRLSKNLPPMEIGMACAVGTVIFGTTGEMSKLEFTTIGEAVNLVAKIEKHSKKISARAVTTVKTFEMGVEQGYKIKKNPSLVKDNQVDGIHHTIDLIVISKNEDLEKKAA